ncbi:MAG: hydrogenase maturation nickel metallochaperone HypA [Candidatus Competibacteraceae bacterium]
MHELSLCLELIRVIEDHARRQSFHRVRLVRLEVGALAGIEIEALRFGFTAATQGTLTEAAVLEIEQPPGLAGCLDCGAVMEICGGEMRIIAFITEAVDVRAILAHLGEPATPPRIASARGPPAGDRRQGTISASRSPSSGQEGLESSLDCAPGRWSTSA